MLHSSSVPLAPDADRDEPVFFDRPIGQLLCLSRGLRPSDVEQVLALQRQHGGRFGEVAIALGLATQEDILEVLARQFDYPCVRSFDDSAVDEELVCARDPLGDDAKSLRELRTELMGGVLSGATPRALAVLSAANGEGRSYVAANLAIAFAQLGGRTLLVDADMRGPRQSGLFGIDNPLGLSQLLSGRADHEVIQQVPRIASLFLIGAGPVPPNPSELVHRAVFARLIREWLARFDYVVLDTPAASCGPESRVIAATAGAALVVAQPQATRMAELQRLLASIGKGPAAVAGVVFNEH